MSSPSRRVIFALLLVSSGLVTPIEAAAGGPTVELTYVRREASLKRGAVGVPIVARCPKAAKVIGGGSTFGSSTDGTILLGSHPFDSDDRGREPEDGWRSVATNGTDQRRSVATWAVCATGTTLTYLSTLLAVPPNSTATATQSCPADQAVSGGGVLIKEKSARRLVSATGPADDSSDVDGTADNAWRARATNGSGRAGEFRTWAICSTLSTLSVVPDPIVIGIGAAHFGAPDCPPGTQVTGGGIVPQSEVPMVVGETRPFSDLGGTPDGGWVGGAYNSSGAVQNVNTYAICLTS